MAIGLVLGCLVENPTVYQHDENVVGSNHYSDLEMQQLRKRMHALVDNLPQREPMDKSIIISISCPAARSDSASGGSTRPIPSAGARHSGFSSNRCCSMNWAMI